MSDSPTNQRQYFARCNTCNEEERGIELATAQEFFKTHVDQGHAVEINRIGRSEPLLGSDTSGSPQRQGDDSD